MNTGVAILFVGGAALVSFSWTLPVGTLPAIGSGILGGFLVGIAIAKWWRE